ncbi:MAG: endonuclease domain-containing protein [Cyanobacteria bacterium J06621_15]
MTQIYNKKLEKEKRRKLRQDIVKAEKIIWNKIRNRQIEDCKFRRQYSVDKFVIDFYNPILKLAIEIDGKSHFKDGIAEYDRERQSYIESLGIRFIRFTNNEVYENLDDVLEGIALKVRELRG